MLIDIQFSVPLEMKILRREHFNRWYKLTPYVLSLLFMEIPFQVSIIFRNLIIAFSIAKMKLYVSFGQHVVSGKSFIK